VFVFSGHSVDHDVGQSVSSSSPNTEAKAVELKRAKPLTSFGDGISLKMFYLDFV
jgi:hypothetical protein